MFSLTLNHTKNLGKLKDVRLQALLFIAVSNIAGLYVPRYMILFAPVVAMETIAGGNCCYGYNKTLTGRGCKNIR